MGDVTGATVVISLVIIPLFPVPQRIQGFAPDDVVTQDEIESVETTMGVDGKLSAGWTWKPQTQTFMLQADSASNDLFDVWNSSQVAGQTTYAANGVIEYPAIKRKLVGVSGFLTRYKLPDVKKLIQPRRYTITWERLFIAPT